jgi:hypothetical protein
MRLPKTLDRLWRKQFGRFEIDDPRPIAEEASYTYFLPSENELLAVAPGDLVKMTIRSVPASKEWDAERMWVIVTATDGDTLSGSLDNFPSDMPQLGPGSPLTFRRSDVIDIIWSDDRRTPPPPSPARREYWERCMVDNCVLYGDSPVDYLYREEPDLGEPDDKYPDSGWRIRGTDEGIAADEAANESPQYVALGAVLNRDDSWLHLIDERIGSRFIRDLDSGEFVVCEEDDQ